MKQVRPKWVRQASPEKIQRSRGLALSDLGSGGWGLEIRVCGFEFLLGI